MLGNEQIAAIGARCGCRWLAALACGILCDRAAAELRGLDREHPWSRTQQSVASPVLILGRRPMRALQNRVQSSMTAATPISATRVARTIRPLLAFGISFPSPLHPPPQPTPPPHPPHTSP